jgi:signal transduction histidine kinase
MHDKKFFHFSQAVLAFGLLLSLVAGYSADRFWQERRRREFHARAADLFELMEQRLVEYETKLKTVYSHYEANRILASGGFGQYLKRLRLQNYPGLARLELVKLAENRAGNPPFDEEWAQFFAPPKANSPVPARLVWHVPLYPVGANYASPGEAVEASFDLDPLFGQLFQKIRLGEVQAKVYLQGEHIAERFGRFEPVYATDGGPEDAGEFWAEAAMPFAAATLSVRLYASPPWAAHGPGLAIALLGGLLNLSLVRAMRGHHTRLLQAHERAVALYERGEAAAFIAHELPNLLTGVTCGLGAALARLEGGHAPEEILRRDLGLAHASALRTCAFLEDLRNRVKHDADSLQPVPVGPLLHRVAALAGLDGRMSGITLAVSADTQDLRVAANPIALEMVLLNLLRNSAEAIRDSGRGGSVSLEAWAEGDKAMLRVADDGPGLSRPEDLFQPFKSSKPYGSGLGLMYCQRQVERRFGGGNRPEGGACFTLALPRWPA